MSTESEWECESCESSESERECAWVSERVTFEHRHENKSCSACLERLNERGKR